MFYCFSLSLQIPLNLAPMYISEDQKSIIQKLARPILGARIWIKYLNNISNDLIKLRITRKYRSFQALKIGIDKDTHFCEVWFDMTTPLFDLIWITNNLMGDIWHHLNWSILYIYQYDKSIAENLLHSSRENIKDVGEGDWDKMFCGYLR